MASLRATDSTLNPSDLAHLASDWSRERNNDPAYTLPLSVAVIRVVIEEETLERLTRLEGLRYLCRCRFRDLQPILDERYRYRTLAYSAWREIVLAHRTKNASNLRQIAMLSQCIVEQLGSAANPRGVTTGDASLPEMSQVLRSSLLEALSTAWLYVDQAHIAATNKERWASAFKEACGRFFAEEAGLLHREVMEEGPICVTTGEEAAWATIEGRTTPSEGE